MSYRIFTDATSDLCPAMTEGLPPITVIPMEGELGGTPFTFGPGGNLTVEAFYAGQREGKFASTSQINPAVYRDAFEPCLKDGEDVLYLCFSSGLSGTIQTAHLCMAELRAEYPERKLVCIDTLCASAGEGFLVREAALRQAAGMTMASLAAWVEDNRLRVCHWFTVDSFDHLRHGGRVSTAAATAGTLLQIKPLLHVDEEGRLQVAEKPRGRRRAVEAQLAHLEAGWKPAWGRQIVVGHGGAPEAGEQLRQEIQRLYPEAETFLTGIGPIIGAHTGPGMLAVIYWGTNR